MEAQQTQRINERCDPIVLHRCCEIATAINRALVNLDFLIRASPPATGSWQEEFVTLERRHVDLDCKTISVSGKDNRRRAVALSRRRSQCPCRSLSAW